MRRDAETVQLADARREQLNELLDLIDELAGWLRAGTFDAEPGEYEVRDRALAVVAKYRSGTVSGRR